MFEHDDTYSRGSGGLFAFASPSVMLAVLATMAMAAAIFLGVAGGAGSLFTRTFSKWSHKPLDNAKSMNDRLKGKTVGFELWGYMSIRVRLLYKGMSAKQLANHLANNEQPHCDYAKYDIIAGNVVDYVRDLQAAIEGRVVVYLEGLHPGKVASAEREQVQASMMRGLAANVT